jgi:hypothetical protein
MWRIYSYPDPHRYRFQLGVAACIFSLFFSKGDFSDLFMAHYSIENKNIKV